MKFKKVPFLTVLLFCAGMANAEGNSPGEAQELANAENDLALATKNNEVMNKQKLIAAAKLKVAEDLAAAAEADLGRAKSELLTRLIGDGYPELRIVSAKILVVEKPEQFCDATYHARYTCHGRPIEDTDPLKEVGKCMFEVNEAAKICRLPGFTEQPMLYTVDFICGDSAKQETIDVPFGGTAYLTCR